MDSREALLWLIAATAFLAVGGGLLNAWLRERKRRARFLYYLHTGPESRRSAPSPLSGSMAPELSAAIRAHAERTARRHWKGGAASVKPTNPYDAGTAENVLWYATYQIVLHDLSEGADRPSGAPTTREPDPTRQ